MDQVKYDVPAIHRAIKAVISEQLELKQEDKEYRNKWQFQRLSYRMTILCSLLAHLKNKTHIKKMTKKFGVYHFGEPIDKYVPSHQQHLLGRPVPSEIVKEFVVEGETFIPPAKKILFKESAKEPGVLDKVLSFIGL